jgi:YaiO family outer membrane protein
MKTALLLVMLALAAPLPAAAQPAAAQDMESLYREGVAARRAGDNARAESLLRRVVAAEPGNSDALVQLGFAHLAQDELNEAEAAFQETLRIAPEYTDARIGLARVAQRRGDRPAALGALEPVDPSNAEAGALRAQLMTPGGAADAARVRLDLDLSYSALEQGRRDWQELSLGVGYQASPSTAVSARVEAARRFGATDVYGEARVDTRVTDDVALYASLGGTPEADFRPEYQVGAGGSVRLREGPPATVLTLDARHARFRAGGVQTIAPGIEQYLLRGRAWLTARWINIFDEDGDHQSGWLARGDVLAGERLRLFAGASDAPDTSEGRVIDTFSLFGGLAWDWAARRTLRLSLAHEDRETGADRLQFGLGFGLRF